MTDPKNEKADPASFEESIRLLGQIVQRLEAGELSLEESLQAFEKGVALARAAQARLDAAESRVEELLTVDAQGKATTRSLVTESRATAAEVPKAKSGPPAGGAVGDDDDLAT